MGGHTELRDGCCDLAGKSGDDARGAVAAALADEEARLALEGSSDDRRDGAEGESGEDSETLEGEHLGCGTSVKVGNEWDRW